jgi:hypothetical protein
VESKNWSELESGLIYKKVSGDQPKLAGAKIKQRGEIGKRRYLGVRLPENAVFVIVSRVRDDARRELEIHANFHVSRIAETSK